MASTPNYNLDTDNKLGGDEASNYIISSQKAIKDYVDNAVSSGSSVEVDSALSADSENPVQNKVVTNALNKKIENTANNDYSLAILGQVNDSGCTAVGANSNALRWGTAIGTSAVSTGSSGSIAVGNNAKSDGFQSVALGINSVASGYGSIQMGVGTNRTNYTLQVNDKTLLDISTGLIPDERISDNIARKGDVSVSLNDITTETQRQAINSGITSAKVSQIETNKSDIATNKSDIATIKSDIATLQNDKADVSYVDDEIKKVGGMPIGSIIPVLVTSDYVPNGCLPCNGSPYTKEQFPDFFNDYLISGRLQTCTYTEYRSDIDTYGSCAKFTIDGNNFRTPFIQDGTFIQQAYNDMALGKYYNAGLPNIEGQIGLTSTKGIPYDVPKDGALTFGDGIGKAAVAGNSSSTYDSYNIGFDASLSNPIYGNSNTVQPKAVAVRYFVVVSTTAINESAMNWSNWASSLQGKVNTDLSNLDTAGKKVIDGQWVAKHESLSTATATGTYTIDLSSYLPDDGYNYELLINSRAYREASDNQTGRTVAISSDIIPDVITCNGVNAHRNNNSRNTFIMIAKKELTFTIAGGALSSLTLDAFAYRRIGTNS